MAVAAPPQVDKESTVPATPEPRRGTVEVRGATKRFGAVTAVDGIDLTVEAGGYVVLLGPSGCGKTTLLRLIGGHETFDHGEFLLDGVRLNDVPPARRDISTVFQHYALFPHKSVFANIEFGLKMRGRPATERRQRVLEVIDFMDLRDLTDRLPRQLSGGQQQRVALARALVIEPTLLLLDEPLGDLDRLLQLRMRVELRAMQRRLGITFIHVTHNQEEALAVADKIVVMQDGRITQIGPPREVYRQPANLFTSGFMGDNNLFSGEVMAMDGGDTVIASEGLTLRGPARGDFATGQPVYASIRASAVRVDHPGTVADGGASNTAPARLVFVEYLGDSVKLHCRLTGGQTLIAKLPERDPAWEGLAEGDDLRLEWDATDVQLLRS